MLSKALKNPDRVKDVFEKLKTDGFISTYEAVNSKLNQPIPLGYCNAGVVRESNLDEFKPGDRVLTNGPHAGIIRSSLNMTSLIPNSVSFKEAPFGIVGAIGLQGVRLAKPEIGETVVVIGLGLVGLMTVQILKASGLNVIASDINLERCKLAQEYGADVIHISDETDLVASCLNKTSGVGADAVLICASSESNDLIYQAAKLSRKRGRIILIGVVGLNLRRDIFYEKEITFQVSSSYGPGRYDLEYELLGKDYPIEYVRWTSKRNIDTVLSLIGNKKIILDNLISSEYDIENANQAYKEIYNTNSIGIIISYGRETEIKKEIKKSETGLKIINPLRPSVGFIGAGNYASRILIPAFKKTGCDLSMVSSSSGISSYQASKKFSISKPTSSINEILKNDDINTIVISTRHNLHAEQVIDCLNHEKNVFVEKPLAINSQDLMLIKDSYEKVNSKENMNVKLMVGFNRRFAPQIQKIKKMIAFKETPKIINITVNAGYLPIDHWINNSNIGGGRIIGEVCHFVDLITYLMDSKIKKFQISSLDKKLDPNFQNISLNLSFEDGNLGTIQYFSVGGKAFPKERVEVFCDNSVLQLDNYRVLRGFNWPSFKKHKLFKQDKGNVACAEAFVNSISLGKDSPISFEEIFHSSKITIDISEDLAS